MTRSLLDGKHGPPHPSPCGRVARGTQISRRVRLDRPHTGSGGSSHGYTFWTCLKKATSPLKCSEGTLWDSSQEGSTPFRARRSPRPAKRNDPRIGKLRIKTLHKCAHFSKASGDRPACALARSHGMSHTSRGEESPTKSFSHCRIL
jgi:hypothetical protein